MLQSLSPANASERDSDGGFSLVEIMVALAIFLVASGAVLGLIMLSLGTVRENSDRVSAATIARGQLDSLRGASYAEIKPFIEASVEIPVDTESGPFTQVTSARWCYFNEYDDTDSSSVECPDASSSSQDQVDPDNECSANIGSTIGLYLRLDVEVASERLDGPQSVSSLIPAAEVLEGIDTGTLTVQVTDSLGNAITNGQLSVNGISQDVVGGCVFVSDLPVGSVSVEIPQGFITKDLGDRNRVVTIEPFTNTQLSLVIEQPRTVTLKREAATSDGTGLYTAPRDIVVRFEPEATGREVEETNDDPGELKVKNLWPGTYTSWLSPCRGSADNLANISSVTVEAGGGDVTELLEGSKVQLVGRKDREITVTYDPVNPDPTVPFGPCGFDSVGDPIEPSPITLPGKSNGVHELLLPDGVWTFSSGSSSITVQLPEPADGNDEVINSNDPDLCSVPLSGLPAQSQGQLLGVPKLNDDDSEVTNDTNGDGVIDRSTEVERQATVPKGTKAIEVLEWTGDAPKPFDLLIVDFGSDNEEVFLVTDVRDDGVVTIGPAGPNAPAETQTAHNTDSIVKISNELVPRCSRL